jgi:hypothetical protein
LWFTGFVLAWITRPMGKLSGCLQYAALAALVIAASAFWLWYAVM